MTTIGTEAPVLDAQLSSGIAEHIQPGERAVAVRVDESNAVGNRLRPGNLVDVFFTLKRDGATGGSAEVEQTQTRLLLSRVRVLAFGRGEAADARGDGNAVARTAVLAVPVADVDPLTLAEGAGRLVLALRNPRDEEVADNAALPAYGSVLKTGLTNAAQASPSTHAAAGIALDQLSGGARPQPAAPLKNNGTRVPPRIVAGTRHDIEVIRGGRAETVAW
jgi:pilus assembly protein CpaB